MKIIQALLLVALSGLNWKVNGVDPDADRTTCEIVIARGFTCTVINAPVGQGYQIEMHRISPPAGSNTAGKRPVILQTGLIGTSADFIFASPNVPASPTVGRNMGIELAKQGYDVWLSNNRGNRYGLVNSNINPSSAEFWDFSFDEISQYDTPAIIDFVRAQTGADKVHFVGHSQGSAVMFALLSQTNAYNDKISSFTAISPITRIDHATTTFQGIIALLKPTLLPIGGKVGVFTRNFVSATLIPLGCDNSVVQYSCAAVFQSMTGPDVGELDISRMDVYFAHQPSSTSGKNLLHFDQLFSVNKFRKYDYGLLNMQKYGQATPPEYDLTQITHNSVHVIYGANDWFVPLDGVKALKDDLPSAHYYQINNTLANHMDPLIGKTIAIEVNLKIIDILGQNN